MKLITYDGEKVGLILEDKVIDISKEFSSTDSREGLQTISMDFIIKNFSEIEGKLSSLGLSTSPVVLDYERISLLPPILNPSKIICTVDNYVAHANEEKTDVFPKPIFFMKPSSVLIGSGAKIILPKFAQRVDHELELAVIIGKTCRNVSAEVALDYVFGYSIFLDMSARDFRTIPYSWFSMKGWDTFGPFGPCVVTADEIGDPQNLEMKLWVNDKLRMQGNTKNMIFSVRELIEAISEVTTLRPGDILATGTFEGVAPVFDGDRVVAEIEKIGRLQMTVERSKITDRWHTDDFHDHYTEFRENSGADQGSDPLAPKAGGV